MYTTALLPPSTTPHTTFHSTLLLHHSTTIALLLALSLPSNLATQITSSQKAIQRAQASLSRSSRWPLGLLDETRQRINGEEERKLMEKEREVRGAASELRAVQEVVAGEVAGWQEGHVRAGRDAVRGLVRGVVVREKGVLEGMQRALRRLTEGKV